MLHRAFEVGRHHPHRNCRRVRVHQAAARPYPRHVDGARGMQRREHSVLVALWRVHRLLVADLLFDDALLQRNCPQVSVVLLRI